MSLLDHCDNIISVYVGLSIIDVNILFIDDMNEKNYFVRKNIIYKLLDSALLY